MTATPLSEIKASQVRRLSTGVSELDWVYGSTTMGQQQQWGLPLGGTSLWAGEAGTGKSRLAVSICSKLSINQRVLYIQNEVSAEQFREWFSQHHDPRRIFVYEETELNAHRRAIRQVHPSLIIVDSVSLLTPTAKQSALNELIQTYRRWAKQINAHILLIGHLNQQGQVKGGTTLAHLADTVVHIEKSRIPDWVEVKIPSKHRFGPTGRVAVFLHRDWGVEPICVGDDRWPMGKLRFTANGRAIRRVPIPGKVGQQMDVDEQGQPIEQPRPRSPLRRLLAGT